MSKIWFCRNCGYEVPSRGRCHVCKVRLSSSPLPELAPGTEEDEVGYRLQDWSDRSRSRLIVRLIEANILHRFEDDELVVQADDEERTDDLVDEITADADADEDEVDAEEGDDPVRDAAEEKLLAEVEILLTSGRRLREDPTDMQADSELAHASATVFIADGFFGTDAATWAAIGRVTRRLLAALGADEALEDDIRLQAGILVKLLEPLVGSDMGPREEAAEAAERAARRAAGPDAVGADELAAAELAAGGDDGAGTDGGAVTDVGASAGGEGAPAEHRGDGEVVPDATVAGTGDGAVDETGADARGGAGEEDEDDPGDTEEPLLGESVYELPEWLPEQRAQLSVYLDEVAIDHEWEGGDLVVAVAVEAEVEALFDKVDGVNADEDDGARYRALEALFAAADRFVNDPDSRPKRLEVVRAVANADGPTPLGLDDAQWWSIRSRARILADSIEHDANLEVIFGEATTLRDMLRVLV